VIAGAAPLVPYVFSDAHANRFVWSTIAGLTVFFTSARRARAAAAEPGGHTEQ
jgi:VIT1/CCC1 family predicted Fe2+/Mn2+ transporter